MNLPPKLLVTLLAFLCAVAYGEEYVCEQIWPSIPEAWMFEDLAGVGVDSGGNVYVADSDSIRKFSAEGALLAEWGASQGILAPFALTVDASDNVYVRDSQQGGILKYSTEGVLLGHWLQSGTKFYEGNGVSGITVGADGRVYTCVDATNRIYVYSKEGDFEYAWGCEGKCDGFLETPTGVAVTPKGNILVTDYGASMWISKEAKASGLGIGNGKLQEFTPRGRFIARWYDGFPAPMGVATDATGNAYVADAYEGDIYVVSPAHKLIDTWHLGCSDTSANVIPMPLAFAPSGDLYVADARNTRILRVSSGTITAVWGTCGTKPGLLTYPYGVAVDPSGNVYVADSMNCRVQKYDASGSFLCAWRSEGYELAELAIPTDVALDAAGNVYVATAARIRVFSSEGTLLREWGSGGSGDGQFYALSGVALDTEGNVYTAVSSLNSVQKFTSDGTYLTQWNPGGHDTASVAVGPDDKVYVVDRLNGTVKAFDTSGNLLASLGDMGVGEGGFYDPSSVAVDTTGNVYILETGSSRFQKFSSDGAFLGAWDVTLGEHRYFYAHDLTVDTAGNVYIADTQRHRIQKLVPTASSASGKRKHQNTVHATRTAAAPASALRPKHPAALSAGDSLLFGLIAAILLVARGAKGRGTR